MADQPSPVAAPAIADLRHRIVTGEYGEGVQLPSLGALAQTWRISDRAARLVQQALIDAGLAERRGRRGVYVRALHHTPASGTPALHPQPRRTISARRHAPADAPCPGDETWTAVINTRTDYPAQDIAAALSVPEDEAVHVRVRVLSDPGGVVALRTSYTLLRTQDGRRVAEGTRLADPTEIPGPWPDALTAACGIRIRALTTHTMARLPCRADARTLSITAGTAVLVLDETAVTPAGPIDVTRTITAHVRLADHYHPAHKEAP